MFNHKEKIVNNLIIIIIVAAFLYSLPVEIIRFVAVVSFTVATVYLFRIYVGNRLYFKIEHLLRIKRNEDAIVLAIKYDNIFNLRKYRIMCKLAVVSANYNMGEYQKAFNYLEKIEINQYDSKYIRSLFCFKCAELYFVLGKEDEGVIFFDEYEKDILNLRKYLLSKNEKIEFDNILLFINTYIKIINKNKEVVNSILKEIKDTWAINDIDKRNYKILSARVKKIK